jgi:thymidylate synthase (FAD)
MKVELISKTIGLNSYEELTAGEIISAIARHGTIKEDNGKLVKYLMDNAHWSPLQHISFGFKIETRRSISAQIFRHRSLNGQEWSLRYSEPLGFETIELRKEHPTNRQSSTDVVCVVSKDEKATYSMDILDTGQISSTDNKYRDYGNKVYNLLSEIEKIYKEGIELGLAKETVRDILPLCTKTTIHITATLRDLLGFLNVRCDEHSQKEIRNIATKIGEELEKELPDIFKTIDWRNGMFM